jgi:hypothetical protein
MSASIEPNDLSKSYPWICLHNFSDVVDCHNANKEEGALPLYKFWVQQNDMLDAMEAKQQLLATNLMSLGKYLHQFVFTPLFKVLEWKPIVDNIVLKDPDSESDSRCTIMMRIFAERLLGTLDFNDSIHLDPVIIRTITVMKSFFIEN